MNHIKAIACALLLILGCGAQAESRDEPEDLGQVEQALGSYIDCNLGVNVGAANNANSVCNEAASGTVCYYNGANGIHQPQRRAFRMGLKTGWASAERTFLGTAANQAGQFINNNFSCWAEFSSWGIYITAAEGGLGRVAFNKGAIGGAPFAGDASTLTSANNLMRMQCDLPTQITNESFPATLGLCGHWTATIDYAKLIVWAQSSEEITRVMRQLFQKAFVIAMGQGLVDASGFGNVTSTQVSRSFSQTTWMSSNGTGQAADLCNYLDINPNPWTCS